MFDRLDQQQIEVALHNITTLFWVGGMVLIGVLTFVSTLMGRKSEPETPQIISLPVPVEAEHRKAA